MNIQSAAHYMKHGYRIKRPHWESGCYLADGLLGIEKRTYLLCYVQNKETKQFEKVKSFITDDQFFIDLEDILADDWVVITDDIKEDFNEYKKLEYNDSIDLDFESKNDWDGI